MDWMNGEEEGGESDGPDGATDGFDGFDAPDDGDLDDEFGGADGFDAEVDDLDGEFGEAGDFDAGMDDLDGGFGGDAGGNVAELEDRIGELENEVSSLSSTMNTVRQENIQIGETVDELDDTIRKLLDIYEMVTRGINPFVDDAREMGGLDGGGDGAFGLFDTKEEEGGDHLDQDVAAAEADSFFDDDLGEFDAATGEREAEIAAEDELSEEERDAPELGADADEEADAESDAAAGDAAGGGASFDDLKAEYEAGDGEWDESDDADEDERVEALDADEDTDVGADAEAATATHDVDGGAGFDPDETGTEGESEFDDAVMESFDRATESDPDAVGDESNAAAEDADDAGERGVETDASDLDAVSADPETSAAGGDAYLDALPPSFVAETLLLEWAAFLVDAGGARSAVRAVRRYREFGWLSADAADDFEAYVVGAAEASSPAGGDALTVDHHTASLAYIVRLAGDTASPTELGLEPRVEDDLTALLGGEHGGIRG